MRVDVTRQPMPRHSNRCRAFGRILILGLIGIASAHAAGQQQDESQPEQPRQPVYAVDATIETHTLGGMSQDVNVLAAPISGLARSGLRVRGSLGRAQYRYLADAESGREASGHGYDVVGYVGYGFVSPSSTLNVLIGRGRTAGTDDGIASSAANPRLFVSVFARPSPSAMVFASLNQQWSPWVTTVQLKPGLWREAGFFLGPEFGATWRQVGNQGRGLSAAKLGLHLSGIRVDRFILNLSSGWHWERDLGGGVFVSGGLYLTF